jgi:hypothetical protein
LSDRSPQIANLKMKRTNWLNYLSVLLVAIATIPLALAPIDLVSSAPILQAAGTNYNRYMSLGYRATARRDYRSALVNFRKALRERKGDRYATGAISNVSRYASRRERRIVFIPGTKGAPINRIGAGVRGIKSCIGDNSCLIALIPDNDRALLTTSRYPQLLFYVPRISAQKLEFLFSSNGETYKLDLPIPKQAGITSIALADLKNAEGKSLPALEIGKKYEWSLAIVVNGEDNSQNLVVDGAIELTQISKDLEEIIPNLAAAERANLYAVNNLWYDAVFTLYQERLSQPKRSSLRDDWISLLKSIDLGNLAQQPIISLKPDN